MHVILISTLLLWIDFSNIFQVNLLNILCYSLGLIIYMFIRSLVTASFSCFVFYAVIDDYDYVFSENGLVAYKNGELIGTEVFIPSCNLRLFIEKV